MLFTILNKMINYLFACIIGMSIFCSNSIAQEIDLNKIKSPIIFEGNDKFAYRDPAVVYHQGKFHLYFTLVERAADSGMYLFTAYSFSEDLVHWSFPRKLTPVSTSAANGMK